MAQWSNEVLQLSKAIAHAEGFGPPDALPTKARNPGDVTGSDAGSFQTNGVANPEGVWNFVNLEDGWQALYIKVDRILRGKSHTYPLTLTLEQVGERYAGIGHPEWAVNVSSYLGVHTSTTLAQLSSS